MACHTFDGHGVEEGLAVTSNFSLNLRSHRRRGRYRAAANRLPGLSQASPEFQSRTRTGNSNRRAAKLLTTKIKKFSFNINVLCDAIRPCRPGYGWDTAFPRTRQLFKLWPLGPPCLAEFRDTSSPAIELRDRGRRATARKRSSFQQSMAPGASIALIGPPLAMRRDAGYQSQDGST